MFDKIRYALLKARRIINIITHLDEMWVKDVWDAKSRALCVDSEVRVMQKKLKKTMPALRLKLARQDKVIKKLKELEEELETLQVSVTAHGVLSKEHKRLIDDISVHVLKAKELEELKEDLIGTVENYVNAQAERLGLKEPSPSHYIGSGKKW